MFNVTIKNKKYRIIFAHHKPNENNTTCIIKDLEDGREIVKTYSLCSKKDMYNREIGRKVSLSRALKSVSEFDREDRRKIWQNYFLRKLQMSFPIGFKF